MESGANLSRTERQPGPPALPVKQRRSFYSDSSGVDLDWEGGALLSPVDPRHQNQPYADVFSEPAHCHAAQCPIHRGDGSSCCSEDAVFFSECNPPPPVPRKKLVRTMSLPEGCDPPPPPPGPRRARPPRPRPPSHHHHHHHHAAPGCMDNPLYMLTPPPPLEGAISPELSFDSPDEELLPYLLCGAVGVSRCVAQRQLLFLRSAARSVMEGADLLLPPPPPGEEAVGGGGAAPYAPEDFQLCDGCEPRRIGDHVYYELRCARFPNKVLGARVYKSDNHFYTPQPPPHVNLQQVLVHFSPSGTAEAPPDRRPSRRPLGGGSESAESQLVPPHSNSVTVTGLLERGHCVSVERDLPRATLEDLIRCRCAVPTSDPGLYAKQLCLVLLQVVTGLQQLCSNRVMYKKLRPCDVFLVWPSRAPTESDRAESGLKEQDGGGGGDEGSSDKAAVQMNWEKLGAPRVVLANPPYRAPSKNHIMASTNAQIGGLIQHGLDPGESLPSVTQCSFLKSNGDPYTERLLDLAGWLQDESAGLQLSDTKTILQAILWGPRAQLFTFMSGMDGWLTAKRTLLVLKMAERGVLQDGPPMDWEDCLCLQYFASCGGEDLRSVSE
ncbi:unnamed protein product [Merluccius merluccius]